MQRKGVKMDNYSSVLTLTKMVFDKIEFERKGFKNENELKFRLQEKIGIVHIKLRWFWREIKKMSMNCK